MSGVRAFVGVGQALELAQIYFLQRLPVPIADSYPQLKISHESSLTICQRNAAARFIGFRRDRGTENDDAQ
jgi:hypothetical protein